MNINRSYYSSRINQFLQDSDEEIFGHLSKHHNHDLEALQKNAWIRQIRILKDSLRGFDGQIYFEFSIPRMGKRVDNIIIINDLIFVIEFKVGDDQFQKYALDQVVDYCLNLKNFHEGSHHTKLVPLVVATKAKAQNNIFEATDNLYEPLLANELNLKEVVTFAVNQSNEVAHIDVRAWENSGYKPTPTIIEAAQALYKGHKVEEISRHDAGRKNLSTTSDCIARIIDRSKAEKRKTICFLTGVPGAGKTLAGLNIANIRQKIAEDEHAVFLSGNGPLVDVLREALTRDKINTAKINGEKIKRKSAEQATHEFIQNIHHFRDEYLKDLNPPIEKVVVFDEAQRAWTKEKAGSFMKQRKGIEEFNMSEPEFLIEVMDRHQDWCTIICLIGGGQEINTGEAGVSEWISALKNRYTHWDIHFSDLILTDHNYLSDENLIEWIKNNAQAESDLHLSVALRSFRSLGMSNLIHSMLEVNNPESKRIYGEIKSEFPIVLTRDLDTAKNWLRHKAKGTERIGLVASSGARRLRPLGVDVKNSIEAPNWFLNPSDDIRSSYYLEEVATEFDIQGLEIDWVCLAWDINFHFKHGEWHYRSFEGTKWHNINQESARSYLLNTYRVLLTRARQGMVLFIPLGDDIDSTRPPDLYNGTFEYLKSIGFPEI